MEEGPRDLPVTKGLLTISKEEWEEAEKFFNDEANKGKIKWSKPEHSKTQHSFIKIPDPTAPEGYQIFAMASRHYVGETQEKKEEKYANIGEGGFGKVKVVQNREGENFAVKIEGRGLRGEKNIVSRITKLLKFTIGEAHRKLPRPKMFKNKRITQKLYTVMQLRKGEELEKYIYFIEGKRRVERLPNQLTTSQNLISALKICQMVQELHDKKIVHGDLKPANIMADIYGNKIMVSSIDFDLSLMLKGNNTSILNISRGTPFYAAPELIPPKWNLNRQVPYSFASDIYALGRMFKEDMQLSPDIYNGMLEKKPEERDSMYTIMANIINTLEKDLDQIVKGFADTMRNDVKSKLLDEIHQKYSIYANLTKKYDSDMKKGTPGNWALTNWMILKAKKASHALDNNMLRKDQMRILSSNLKKLTDLNSDENVINALKLLYTLRNQIRDEKNKFTPSLEKTCDKIISEIKTAIGEEHFNILKKTSEELATIIQQPKTNKMIHPT